MSLNSEVHRQLISLAFGVRRIAARIELDRYVHRIIHVRHKIWNLIFSMCDPSVKMDITTTQSKDVQHLLSTPREAKRLKIQHTADMADPM